MVVFFFFLLDVDVLSAADIGLVMKTTDAMTEVLARPISKVPALRGRSVTIIFYEASTRTRVSFEVAANRTLNRERMMLQNALRSRDLQAIDGAVGSTLE